MRPAAPPLGAVAVALAIAAAVVVDACDASPTGTLLVGCPANLMTGTLEPLGAADGMGIFDGSRHLVIDWHGGVTTTRSGGRLIVVDPAGRVIAGVGDVVQLLGGETRAGVWFACDEPFGRTPAPS